MCNIRLGTNFDELIRKIYGDVSSIEKYEEEENAQLNKRKIMNNEYYNAESVKRSILQQNEQRVSPWLICFARLTHKSIVLINSNSVFIWPEKEAGLSSCGEYRASNLPKDCPNGSNPTTTSTRNGGG